MLLNGVDVDDLNSLRENIVRHFGSLSAFSRSTGFSYRLLKRTLLNLEFSKEEIDEISSIYEEKKDPDNIPFRISEEESEKIRVCIFSNFRKVVFFCEKHSEYNSVYISNIINGKLKLRSTKYVRLVKLLEKKYDLK